MARVLWPDEPDEISANRLRVSLNRLRSLLGPGLVTDRHHVRLAGISVTVDLWDEERNLQSALDEVDPNHQLELIKAQADKIRGTAWQEFTDIDLSGSLKTWDGLCRKSIIKLSEVGSAVLAWEFVDLAWELMRARGELDQSVCECYFDSHNSRGTLDEGFKKVRKAARDSEISEGSEVYQALLNYAQRLKEKGPEEGDLQTAHYQLLGSALLSQPAVTASLLAELLAKPEVQFHMQAVPSLYLPILETVLGHLETNSAPWVEIQSARLSAYASMYDSDKVIEISESLIPCDMPAQRRAVLWMNYSFILFQIRRWDDALESIRKAQAIAQESGDHNRFEICRLAEGSYLWHVGEAGSARQIYDKYIEDYSNSDDFIVGVNLVITHANYGVLELVYGDVCRARRHVDLAYAERNRSNIARLMQNLLSLMGVIYGRSGEIDRGVDLAIEGLKLTYPRGSSREGQVNMEWACGLLVLGGLRHEAWSILEWINEWRKRTKHTRSIAEGIFCHSLELQEFEGKTLLIHPQEEYRKVLTFLIKCLRDVQASKASYSGETCPTKLESTVY